MEHTAKPTAGTLSSLFLGIEKIFGSRDSCFLAMDSMREAIREFKGSTAELEREITGLCDTITAMSPRIALLIMMMFTVLEEYNVRPAHLTLEEEKNLLLGALDRVKQKRQRSVEKLLQYSDGIIHNNEIILLHDISHTVFDVIRRAYQSGVRFEVLVAGQEEKNTETIVAFLQELSIPFTVVPEYLLIHVIASIDKAFLGAVTINSFHEVIADAGSKAIVSQMQDHGIPVYVPITTDKLSLWKAEQRHHSLKTTKYHSLGGREYNKLVFSHDRYPLDKVTAFITNKGLLSPAHMKELYESYFTKLELWRTKTGV